MSIKKPSSAAKPASRVTEDQAEKLADLLADKPYGLAPEAKAKAEEEAKAKAKAKVLSISLPGCLIAQLEDAAFANKRSGEGPKSISGIIRQALEAAGFVDRKEDPSS